MREILFRGKRIDNGEWVEGYIYEHEPPLIAIVPEDYVPELSKWYILRTAFADWNLPRQVEFIEVDPSTVCQYTGLTDKNGKKIFEGDILKVWRDGSCRTFCVKWRETGVPMYILYPQPINEDFWHCRSDMQMAWEVIGNIFDNPEPPKEDKP